MPTAVVTGGSSGIGLAVGRLLSGRGYRVVLAARGQDRLHAAADEIGARAVPCDVTSALDVVRLGRAAEALGGCDLLVQSAGIPGGAGVLDADPDAYARLLETNLLGLVRVTRALWPQLLTRGARVANVISVAGTVSVARSGPYCASKHAAIAWSRAFGSAARPLGVRVTTVNPGPVATPGFPQSAVLRHRLARLAVISPERCAAGILRAVDRGDPEAFVPAYWRAAAVAQALAPGLVGRLGRRVYSGGAADPLAVLGEANRGGKEGSLAGGVP